MNLHLTRDQWDRIAAEGGGGVLFRKGAIRDGFPYENTAPTLVPPAEFVEAAQPCETCGGTGWRPLVDGPVRGVVVRENGLRPEGQCPDCLDGKRRIAVVVPCDQQCDVYPCKRANADCSGGVRTVGHVVVESGPESQDDGRYRLAVRVVG